MNGKELTKIVKMSQTAADIIQFMADRKRNTVYTSFAGLRADLKKKLGHAVDAAQLDAVFKELEKMGAGKLEYSPKRNVCLGFFWTTPVREIGEAVKTNVVTDVPKEQAPTVERRKGFTVVLVRHNGQAQTVNMTEQQLMDLNIINAFEASN